MMKNGYACAFAIGCACMMLMSSCSIFSGMTDREDFIRVQGTQLIHRDAPYYYAGTNLWYGCYLGSPGSTGDRPRLLRELDALYKTGVTNLRVLGGSEETELPHTATPSILRGPGVVDDTLLQGLDFLLAEMAKRDMHAVIYLSNYWEWSGGFYQYNLWAGDSIGDPKDGIDDWNVFMDFSGSFYARDAAVKMYRDYVELLIGRINTVNGRLYSEDPTIMAWQLANEPRPGPNPATGEMDLPLFYRWVDETAMYIHSLDSNHLVSTGSEGSIGTLEVEEYYLQSHRTSNIDYLTFHLWAYNWGWFKPKRWEETLPDSKRKAKEYIGRQLAMARSLGKPIVMEEFGLGRDEGEFRWGTPTRARDEYYEFVYRVLEDSARSGAPIAGSNFWAWGGEGSARNQDGMWLAGDPFTGDPPQEPQGQNSVFVSDTSTLRIISDHAERMRKIGLPPSMATTDR